MNLQLRSAVPVSQGRTVSEREPSETRGPAETAAVLLDAMDQVRKSRPNSLQLAAELITAAALSHGISLQPEQSDHLAQLTTSWRWRMRHPRRWIRYRFQRRLTITG